jgi:hypothetical protein
MKLQQVEEHFDALDLNEMAPGGALHFSAADVKNQPAEVLTKICGIYQKIRPFIVLASELFLVPKKWRDALKSYMANMDQVCPS